MPSSVLVPHPLLEQFHRGACAMGAAGGHWQFRSDLWHGATQKITRVLEQQRHDLAFTGWFKAATSSSSCEYHHREWRAGYKEMGHSCFESSLHSDHFSLIISLPLAHSSGGDTSHHHVLFCFSP